VVAIAQAATALCFIQSEAMPSFRTVLVVLACAGAVSAADTAKLRTLKGETREGPLVSISDKEIVLTVKGSPLATPVAEVLDLELQPAGTNSYEGKYTDIELTDGSVLHCSQFALKGKQAELKLISGQEIKVPLAAVVSILNEAHDAQVREEWQGLLSKRGNRDLLAVKGAGGKVNALDGTFGDAGEDGETIEFESASGAKRELKVARIHAMSFNRKLDAELPEPLCKVIDTSRNVLMVSRLTLGDKGFAITTPAGGKVEYPRNLVARLDYSKGKLTYLSDLEPLRVVERANLDGLEHYRRDKNLVDEPLRLVRKTGIGSDPQIYTKGLALYPYTELVYDIGGQYKEFKVVLGLDPVAGLDNAVRVTIEGDGRELFAGELHRKDNPLAVVRDVKNVRQLRIVASSPGRLFLSPGGHVILGDAKVSK
jgi:hypothetical protein